MYNRGDVLKYIQNDKAFLDTVVKENIEKYRKGDAILKITDENGEPLPNTRVKIKQTSHEFKFGANIFMLDELETDEKNEAYKNRFKELFNMATLPFYWTSIEPKRGELRYEKNCAPYYRRPSIDLCMEFCRENGIEPREHGLAYEHHFPGWLKGATTDEVKRELERRYKEISERYADKIPTIEVTNEMFWWEGVSKFYDDDEYIEWCFKLARKYFPSNQLVINEATEESWCEVRRANSKYYSYIRNALLCGAPIDAIGMQFHAFYTREREIERAASLYHPTNIYNYLDFYSKLINALQITEITIPAYSNDIEDEEIQAEILENLYKVWFSHPSVEQIIYWNLVDGYAYVENPTPERIRSTQGNMSVGENKYYAGILRFDMSPKPAYLRLKKLIKELWNTSLEATTDENGFISFRGFFGGYEIEAQTKNGTIKKNFSLSSKK